MLAADNTEDIKALEIKSKELQEDGQIFSTTSKVIRRQACKDLIKSKIFLYTLIALLLFVIGFGLYMIITKS